MRKIRKDDTVVVIAGDDKGAQGKVISYISESNKVIVQGVALVKKSVKPVPAKGITGGIVTKERPIPISKVALLDPSTNKAGKVRVDLSSDGTRSRVFKRSGQVVNVEKV